MLGNEERDVRAHAGGRAAKVGVGALGADAKGRVRFRTTGRVRVRGKGESEWERVWPCAYLGAREEGLMAARAWLLTDVKQRAGRRMVVGVARVAGSGGAAGAAGAVSQSARTVLAFVAVDQDTTIGG